MGDRRYEFTQRIQLQVDQIMAVRTLSSKYDKSWSFANIKLTMA
jgi:hypothetical protein